MADYILSCCSTADLTKEHFQKRDIRYVCFHFIMNGKDYPDDLGESYPFDRFYADIAAGGVAKTSQVNISEYVDYFEPVLRDEGKDIVHLSLSSGISGSANSAKNAAELLQERYPERHIYVIDSLAASGGFGLLVDKAADLRDSGMSAAELADWLETNKRKLHHWFFSTDLTSFVRGGRISKAAGVFGGALHICPLMNVDFQGRLIPREKVRTKKKVIPAIVEKMVEHAENGRNYSGKCFITHSACLEDAKQVAALVEEKFPSLNGTVQITSIGTTIGAHTGPGTVALFFWGDERND